MKYKLKRDYKHLDQRGIVHAWCNNHFSEFDEYEVIKKYKYFDVYKDRIYSKIGRRDVVVRFKNDIFIESNFGNNINTSFGNSSLNSYLFRNSIPEGINSYYFHRVDNIEKLIKTYKGLSHQSNFEKWYGAELLSNNSSELQIISLLLSNANNPNVISIRSAELLEVRLSLPELPKYFKNPSIKRKRAFKLQHDVYAGWTHKGKEDNGIRFFSIEELLEFSVKDLFFTNRELYLIELKSFINSYGRSTYNTNSYVDKFDKLKEIYDDLDKRKDFIEKRKKTFEEIERLKKVKELKNLHNKLRDYNRLLERYHSGGSDIPPSVFLSTGESHIRLNNDLVETSRGVRISLENAKKAYRLYKLAKANPDKKLLQEDRLVEGFKFESYTKRNTLDIDKLFEVAPLESDLDNLSLQQLHNLNYITKEVSGIVIGCHFITETEIERFMERHNFDW